MSIFDVELLPNGYKAILHYSLNQRGKKKALCLCDSVFIVYVMLFFKNIKLNTK